MKYLKRWIDGNFPNITLKTSDSGSCYYNIDDCLSIRISNHFTPLPSSKNDLEIVQSSNCEEFAVRYKKSLSFFLYNRAQVKNVINTMYDIKKSDKQIRQTAEEIVANNEEVLRQKYNKGLSLTRIFISSKRYEELVTTKKVSVIDKMVNKCEFYMAQDTKNKAAIKKAYTYNNIKGKFLLDLIIRSYYSKDINEVNKVIAEMSEYICILERKDKAEKAKVIAAKIVEKVTKEADSE